MPTCGDCGGGMWDGHVCPRRLSGEGWVATCEPCGADLPHGGYRVHRRGCPAHLAAQRVAWTRPDGSQLVGMAEASEILGVSDARVGQLVRQDEDFPAPLTRLRATPIWWRPDLELYAVTRVKKKAGRPKKTW